jgi:hypothetical protein
MKAVIVSTDWPGVRVQLGVPPAASSTIIVGHGSREGERSGDDSEIAAEDDLREP